MTESAGIGWQSCFIHRLVFFLFLLLSMNLYIYRDDERFFMIPFFSLCLSGSAIMLPFHFDRVLLMQCTQRGYYVLLLLLLLLLLWWQLARRWRHHCRSLAAATIYAFILFVFWTNGISLCPRNEWYESNGTATARLVSHSFSPLVGWQWHFLFVGNEILFDLWSYSHTNTKRSHTFRPAALFSGRAGMRFFGTPESGNRQSFSFVFFAFSHIAWCGCWLRECLARVGWYFFFFLRLSDWNWIMK